MSDSPSWLNVAAIAALVGSGTSGLLGLLRDWIQHHRERERHYWQILLDKQINACGELMRMLIELHAGLAPVRNGVELLRWPKDRRVTPNPTDQQIEEAKQIARKIEELSHFVAVNEILLGNKIVEKWI